MSLKSHQSYISRKPNTKRGTYKIKLRIEEKYYDEVEQREEIQNRKKKKEAIKRDIRTAFKLKNW